MRVESPIGRYQVVPLFPEEMSARSRRVKGPVAISVFGEVVLQLGDVFYFSWDYGVRITFYKIVGFTATGCAARLQVLDHRFLVNDDAEPEFALPGAALLVAPRKFRVWINHVDGRVSMRVGELGSLFPWDHKPVWIPGLMPL